MERHHKNKVSDCSALKITTNIPMTLIDKYSMESKKERTEEKKKLKDPEGNISNFNLELLE